MHDLTRIQKCVEELYGSGAAPGFMQALDAAIGRRPNSISTEPQPAASQKEAMLITYPDMVQQPGRKPLVSLREFCEKHLDPLITDVHVLPFFPSSSDDGFAVMDYKAVDPQYGEWSDIRDLGRRFRLMFDAVINHASAQGKWFRGFLQGEAPYQDFFVSVAGNPDLSNVVRPRTLPLLTRFKTMAGERQVWTTFGPDQVDLDYRNPRVLLEVLDTLLFYIEQGASLIRLDAIAYAWKEPGTTCIHRPQVHAMVRLMRAVVDAAAPHVRLITETNVPHAENVRYLGDGTDEAHLVYNFSLPPLLLHTLRSGRATTLTEWAESIIWPPSGTAFLNVLATHDGIGLNGLRGLIDEAEIASMAEAATAERGQISRKTNPDGTSSPYEINANYFDALALPGVRGSEGSQVSRFLTAHAIMLALKGVPALYLHSLVGSRGWNEGVERTGHARTINREKLDRMQLETELEDHNSLRQRVFAGMRRLLRARRSSSAFSPHAAQRVLHVGDGIFAFWRINPEDGEQVLCAHNVTDRMQVLPVPLSHRAPVPETLLGPARVELNSAAALQLTPYESIWLRMKHREEE